MWKHAIIWWSLIVVLAMIFTFSDLIDEKWWIKLPIFVGVWAIILFPFWEIKRKK